MAAKSLVQFLLFSQALAGGFNWLLTRDEWQKRQDALPEHQQAHEVRANSPQAGQQWVRTPRGRYEQSRHEERQVNQIGDG